MTDPRVEELVREIESMERPGLAKAAPRSRRELADERAAAVYTVGFDATKLSETDLALTYPVDRRVVRDWRNGARIVPVYAILMLPRDAALKAAKALVHAIDEGCVEDSESARRSA